MIPVSLPVIPAQPNKPVYGFGDLGLFVAYTRDSYKAEFGVDAPNWDPSRPVKTWFDTSGGTTYNVPSNVTNPASIVPMALSASDAASVNLPGVVPFPAYVIQPTVALRAGFPINPIDLSDLTDAQEIAKELGLGASTVFDATPTGPLGVVYGTETRRMYDILTSKGPLSAGRMLADKLQYGLGRGGKWDMNAFTWLPDALPPDGIHSGVSNVPAVPMPIRELLPTEQEQSTLMGTIIVRTDLVTPPNGGRGDISSADFAKLMASVMWIEQELQRLDPGAAPLPQ